MDGSDLEYLAEERAHETVSSGDAPSEEAAPEEIAARAGMPVEPAPAHNTGRRWLLRNTAMVALALFLIAGAVGTVLLASRTYPAVPARIINPDGLLQQSNAPAYPTLAPIHATPAVCPCGTPLQTKVPLPPGGVPNIGGQVVLVSLSQQWLWAFSNRQLVFSTPVTTGRPELPTPTGIFDIYQKAANTTFYSPWPPGSPYYYPPEHVNYAMLFLTGGFYIHDAPWRSDFGPGTNVPHVGPGGQQETGSHGCVEVPTSAGAWLYPWAQYGTTVDIVG